MKFTIKLRQHIKKIGSAKSRCWYRQSVAITPPQRDNQVCRIKLYINQRVNYSEQTNIFENITNKIS
jgi:hypothetical protein